MSRRFLELSQADLCLYVAEALNRRALKDAQVKIAFIDNNVPARVRFAVDEVLPPEVEPDRS